MSKRASMKPAVSFLFAAILACPIAVLAAPGDGGGGGGGTAPDYGDMFVLLRAANGVPILTPETTAIDPETGLEVPAGSCQQPIALPSDTCPVTCSEGVPCLVPLDPITCGVAVGYETCTQEVDFSRMNVARAPAAVMDRQLADVVVNLATADCITLDPAGRLVYTSQDINDSDGDGVTLEYISSAVDSPLQNLAIYKEMILRGELGDPADPIELPQPFTGYGYLDTAAKGLGAASDKGGSINVDLVVYLNQILGLPDLETTNLGAPICINVRQEVQGVVQLVEKCFLNYAGYGYERSETYSALPYPAYIPQDNPLDGWFEYLALYPDVTGPDGEPLFWIVEGPILPAVFPDTDTTDLDDFLPGFEDGNIGGLAQAADDARAVIDFMHTNPVLIGYETPLTCGAPHVTAYDVSISPDSGLQVPVRMVFGTEREGTVAVANAGPDAASGVVTVTGANSNGLTLVGPMQFTFNDLAAGASQSWPFPIELNANVTWVPWAIFWTATVTAEDDVNPANNTVTEVTRIFR